jgi:hypothetical protein
MEVTDIGIGGAGFVESIYGLEKMIGIIVFKVGVNGESGRGCTILPYPADAIFRASNNFSYFS